jgi:hypothetical protein
VNERNNKIYINKVFNTANCSQGENEARKRNRRNLEAN